MKVIFSDISYLEIGVGVFQAYYQAHQLQSESPSTVSWIPGLSMFMMFITVSLLPIWTKWPI
jgi:hypothetical protein